MSKYEIPMGLGMALSHNLEAMQKFSMLSDNQKLEIIEGTHSIQSKEEMRQYVENIFSEKQ